MKRFLFLASCFLFFSQSYAQLSPGKLAKVHASLEGIENCTKCHAIKKRVSADHCLSCHKLLGERIAQHKGLHANKNYKACTNCHVEHQGRNYELIYWKEGKNKFNHELTGYKLQGKHSQLKCGQCHQGKNIVNKEKLLAGKKDLNRTFLGLDQNCLSCHRDEHRGQIDGSCLNCHNMEAWKPAQKFDHQRTRFPLSGKHQDVKCEKCHTTIVDNKFSNDKGFQKFTGIAFSNCTDCHKDVHRNRFGQNCRSCHSTRGWERGSRQKFDHNLTRYPLRGRHASLKCDQCHLPGKPLKIAHFAKCKDCHADYHRGDFLHRPQYGNCEECHSVEGFVPSKFTIAKHNQSRFSLLGAHLAVPCNACHVKQHRNLPNETMRFKFSSIECISCHKNPHGNQVDKYLASNGCEYCHSITSWREMTFDHNKTKFALQGRHKEVECRKCHQHVKKEINTKLYQFSSLSSQCQACHKDIHYGQFKEKKGQTGITHCERCHSPIDWLADKFQHNRDSRFKIDGAHQYVRCEQCHPKVEIKSKTFRLYKLLRTDCKFCHGRGKSLLGF